MMADGVMFPEFVHPLPAVALALVVAAVSKTRRTFFDHSLIAHSG